MAVPFDRWQRWRRGLLPFVVCQVVVVGLALRHSGVATGALVALGMSVPLTALLIAANAGRSRRFLDRHAPDRVFGKTATLWRPEGPANGVLWVDRRAVQWRRLGQSNDAIVIPLAEVAAAGVRRLGRFGLVGLHVVAKDGERREFTLGDENGLRSALDAVGLPRNDGSDGGRTVVR